ncbi:MAG TPA: LamG domain-containing protein, partial [Saprospiraceae bacterium]|nr:LamG domain-containing protein [Saprospiraceae bacterium]
MKTLFKSHFLIDCSSHPLAAFRYFIISGILFLLAFPMMHAQFYYIPSLYIERQYEYCERDVKVKFLFYQSQGDDDYLKSFFVDYDPESGSNQRLINFYREGQLSDFSGYQHFNLRDADYPGLGIGPNQVRFYYQMLEPSGFDIELVVQNGDTIQQTNSGDFHLYWVEFNIKKNPVLPGGSLILDFSGFWEAQGGGGDVNISLADQPTTLTAPQTPISLSATQNECGQITLDWSYLMSDPCPNAMIQIRRNGNDLVHVPASQTTYSNTGLAAGVTYTYEVRMVHGTFGTAENYSGLSNSAVGKTHDPPGPISGFELVSVDCEGDVSLHWTNGGPYIDIVIFQDGNPTGDTLAGSATSYSTNIGTGTTAHTFAIKGIDVCGASTLLVQLAQSVTTPQTPGNFTLNNPVEDPSGVIKLTWTASQYATEYTVIRKSDAGQVEFTTSNTMYSDDGVSTCIQYSYRVIAENICGTKSSGPFINAPVISPDEPVLDESGLVGSKGYYPDRVDLDWLRPDNLAFDHYKIFRRRLDSNGDSIQIGEASKNAVHYVDEFAQAGVLYRYYVVSTSECNGVATSSNAMTDIGFRLPVAFVSGNVHYENGQAVEGVQIVVDRVEGNIGRAMRFHGNGSLEFNTIYGGSQDLNLADQMTVEFWMNQLSQGDYHLFRRNQPSGQYGLMYLAGQGFVQYHNDGANTAMLYTFEGLDTLPYVHVAWVRDGADLHLYVNGVALSGTPTDYPAGIPQNHFSVGEGLDGLIDEVRFWSGRAKTLAEVQFELNRFLKGDEQFLIAYWGINEGIGTGVYDISGINEQFNANHLMMSGDATWESDNIPNTGQIGNIAYSDADGNYIVTNIRYTDQGNTFSVNPFYSPGGTPHDFEPAATVVFLGEGAIVQSGIDFVDKSSFRVRLRIKYENPDGPCENTTARILVDGQFVVKDGQILEYDPDQELYEFDVPIGRHRISVQQAGHVFADGGTWPPQGQPMHDFQSDIDGIITIVDLTTVRIAGRVVGGSREAEKKLTFDKSINNIGMADVQFISENTCHMPDALRTDSLSGEYVIDLLPFRYNVDVDMIYNFDFFQDLDAIDFTFIPDTMWVRDTLKNPGGEVLDVDSNFYHYAHNFIHRAVPSLDVSQAGSGEPLTGEEYLVIQHPEMGDADTIPLTILQYPVFLAAKPYRTRISAFEEYTNIDSGDPIADHVPVTDGTLRINNGLGNSAGIGADFEEQILLQSADGDTTYTFIGSIPEVTPEESMPEFSFTKTFEVTLISPQGETSWMPGGATYRGYVFGGLPIEGSSFITEGPETVDYILRDPPGSGSSAYFKEESTTTKSKGWFTSTGSALSLQQKLVIGTEVSMSGGAFGFVEVGYGIRIQGIIDNQAEVALGFDASGNYTESTTYSTTIATSSAANQTGSPEDLFVGKSYNYLFGAAYELTMIDTQLCHLPGAVCLDGSLIIINGTAYKLGTRTSVFMVPESFSTEFIFSQYHIENNIMPALKQLRDELILMPGNEYEVGVIPVGHPAFGLNNDDPRLTELGYTHHANDPYTTEEIDYSGDSYTYTVPSGVIPDDRVRWYNQQIRLWEEALAQNEKEKLEASQKRNISFSAGTTYSYDHTSENSEVTTQRFEVALNLSSQVFASIMIAGSGADIGFTLSLSQVIGGEFSQGSSEIDAYGYTLADENTGDFFSIDVKDGGHGNGPVFSLRGGESMCPWERGEVTEYYEPGTPLSESTIRREWPDLDVSPAIAVNVPEHQPASFTLKLRNLSPTGDIQWYGLRVLDQTNPLGANLSIDGATPNRVFEIQPGQTVEKILKLKKADADNYEGIQLVLYSTCEYDAFQNGGNLFSADTITIGAHFVPTCSPVSIEVPDDQWILNVSDNDMYDLLVTDFDQEYSGFQRVQLQYKPTFSSDWKGIETFWKDEVPSGQNGQAIAPGAASQGYQWDVSQIADGPYNVRAVSFCLLNMYESPAVTGIIDRMRPHAFGNPQPADGVLDPDDEIMVQFNETVDPTAISRDNFSIRGVLNGTELRHGTAVQLDGMNDCVIPPAGTRVGAHPMTIEMWVRRTSNGAATLWSQGEDADSSMIFGINASNYLYLRHYETTITSNTKIENDGEWHHVAITYGSTGVVSFYKTGVFFTSGLLDSVVSIPGPLVIGKNAWDNNGPFAGYIHEFRIWRTEQTLGQLQSLMLKMLSGNEPGLSILWPMDEGTGTQLRDIVRKKHATLFGDWAILPSGQALTFDGNDRLDITPSNIVFTRQHNFTLEFWMKSAPGGTAQTILSNGKGDGTDGHEPGWSISAAPAGTLQVDQGGQAFTTINKNVCDNNWHHIALVMNRNGNLNTYLDGLLQTSLYGSNFGEFAGPKLFVAARGWPIPGSFSNDQYFNGDLDEIRVWNTVRTREQIQLNMQHRLLGHEPGLLMYLPFEGYEDVNDIAILTPNLMDVSESMLALDVFGDPMHQAQDPNIKLPRPVVDINFTYSVNDDKIILTLQEDPVRVENIVLDISTMDLQDLRGNAMAGPVTWTAYVNKNQLHWNESELSFEKPEKEALTFEAEIENTGGVELSFDILNLPEWLIATPSTGSIGPVRSKTIQFSIDPYLNLGDYSIDVNLLSGQGFNDKLIIDVHVFGVPPTWDIDPAAYAYSMNVVADLDIFGELSDDPLDRVVAYVNGEVRGMTTLEYMPELDRYLGFLEVYSNVTSGEQVSFKVWDASTGTTY